MGLQLNEKKTKTVNAADSSFDFLGFTVRYSRDIHDRGNKYWDIFPSKKSQQKIRDKINEYLSEHGHSPAMILSHDLNAIIRGWMNYFNIAGVSYPKLSFRMLRHYLCAKLHRYYNRKSQRKSRLYRQKAFEVLTSRYGLIDPTKYSFPVRPVNAYVEVYGKAVCGRTARTV